MKPMKLLKSGVLSILLMWVVVVVFFFVAGIGNELQVASTLGAAIVSPIVIATAFLVWGLPAYLVLNKLNKSSPSWYALAGFVPGPIFIAHFKPFGNDALQYLLYQSVFCGVIGALGAVIFWYGMVRKNA